MTNEQLLYFLVVTPYNHLFMFVILHGVQPVLFGQFVK